MDAVIKNNFIQVFSEDISLFQVAAKDFVYRAIKSVTTKKFFNVVLSGGDI